MATVDSPDSSIPAETSRQGIKVLQVDTRAVRDQFGGCIRTWPGGANHAEQVHRFNQDNPSTGQREYLCVTPLMTAWQCRRVGWEYDLVHRACPADRHPSWVKLDHVLATWDALPDAVMVLDTDAWIRCAEGLRHIVTTRLLDRPDVLFLGVEEPKCQETQSTGADVMNGGFMCFKRDDRVRRFFQQVWDLGRSEWATRWPWEQACLSRAFHANLEGCQEWTDILPLTMANTPAGTHVSHCWYKDKAFDLALGDLMVAMAAELLGTGRRTVEFVVARYGEDVSWIDQWLPFIDRVTIYDKSDRPDDKPHEPTHPKVRLVRCANVGREAHSYATHFADNHDDLCDIIVCTQAKHDDHLSKAAFDAMVRGCGDYPGTGKGLDMGWGRTLMDHFGWTVDRNWSSIPMQPSGMTAGRFFLQYIADDLAAEDRVDWWHGAIFRTTRDKVRRHPAEKYAAIRDVAGVGPNPEAAHLIERSWKVLLDGYRAP